MKKERTITGRTLALIMIAAVAAGGALVAGSFYLNSASSDTTTMQGILFVNSSGSLNGTGTNALYNATLDASGGVGTLELSLLQGTDLLQTHSYQVSNLRVDPYNLNFSLGGSSATLPWLANSTSLKDLNYSYVASWGPGAAAALGSIDPSAFSGLAGSYYVLISLTVTSQPSNNIPFAVDPSLG